MKGIAVAVVGGGVVGAACARALARKGLPAAVFEPGPDPAAATPASAGMLAAQIEPTEEGFLALAVRGRDLYEALATELSHSTEIDIGLWRGGIASLAFDEARAAELKDLVALQRQAGLRCDWLSEPEVLERWPGVAPQCLGALFAPEDGAVDPAALARALLADARLAGVEVVKERVEQVVTVAGRVTGVRTLRGTVPAERVVLAAGAWSPGLTPGGRILPVEPVRGQMAATAWPPGTPPAILYHNHGYVLARGGEALLGSTMERVGFDARSTKEGVQQIVAGAARILPALGRSPIARSWAGLRPVTPDGLPVIGPEPGVEGLVYATGHGRNGVLLAALTGDIVAELVATGKSELDLAPFRPERFPSSR